MNPERVARLIEQELRQAKDAEMLEVLHSAEHLVKVCIESEPSPGDVVLFENLLEDVKGRIRKHCL